MAMKASRAFEVKLTPHAPAEVFGDPSVDQRQWSDRAGPGDHLGRPRRANEGAEFGDQHSHRTGIRIPPPEEEGPE
jgi:hypothetical protein